MTENIRALSEKDKVRKKISVWLGASNHIAVLHTVKELVGNSVDEVNKGNGDKIKIVLHDDKTITVEDNCQGLPVEGTSDGVENYKLLFETLFAGTKYDNGIENNDYTVGVNGVFNTVLAFSSEDVEFQVARPNGNVYSVSYHKGDNVKPLEIIGKSDNTYSRIKYTLDDDIFEENYFNLEELEEIASEQASMIDGSIEVVDERSGESKVFEYENGISDFLEHRIENMTPISDTITYSKDVAQQTRQNGEDVVDDIKVELAIRYTREADDNTHIEFLNGSNLIHHGTIYDGMIGGLRTAINRFLRENDMYNKSERQITRDDVMTGLNYVIDFKSYFPTYANQTKFASYIKYYEPVMRGIIEELFEVFSVENRLEMERIANQILSEKRARERAENTRMNVRKKLSGTVDNITNRIDGFINCRSKDNTETELFVVEGKSALGATKQGRDANTQGIYALRGKVLNCLKADYDRIFKNDIIVDLIKILGCGVEVRSGNRDLNTFDIDKLRWSKIIITTDADVDGFHIRTLILTMIYRLMPTLIREGKVYIAESPLYEIVNKGESYFAYNDAGRDEILSKLEGSVNIQRSKGLGENTAEMMWETTMDPETRRVIQVTEEDVEETQRVFDLFLGDNLDGRKQFIEDNLHKYVEEALD